MIIDRSLATKFEAIGKWESLVPKRKGQRGEKEMVKYVYSKYAEAISAIADLREKQRGVDDILLRHMRVILRDSFMEATLLGMVDEVAIIDNIFTLFNEDRGKMVNDINKIFTSPYNCGWRVGALYLKLIVNCCNRRYDSFDDCCYFPLEGLKSKKLSDFIGYENQLGYDGERSIGHLDDSDLLAYRIVNNIKEWKEKALSPSESGEGINLYDFALSLFNDIQKRVSERELHSITFFQKKFYSLVHLAYSESWRESFPLQSTKGERLEEALLSEEGIYQPKGGEKHAAAMGTLSTVKGVFRHIVENGSPLKFSGYKSSRTPHTPKSPGRTTSQTFLKRGGMRKKAEEKTYALKKIGIERSLSKAFAKVPLPYIYRLALSKRKLALINLPGQRESELVAELNRRLKEMGYFRGEKSYGEFVWYLTPFKRELSRFNTLRDRDKSPVITGSLELLFSGKLREKKIQALLDDLNRECVKLYSRTLLADIDAIYSFCDKRYRKIEQREAIRKKSSLPKPTSADHGSFHAVPTAQDLFSRLPDSGDEISTLDFAQGHLSSPEGIILRDVGNRISCCLTRSVYFAPSLEGDGRCDRIELNLSAGPSESSTLSMETFAVEAVAESSSSNSRKAQEKKTIALDLFFNEIYLSIAKKLICETDNLEEAAKIIKSLLAFADRAITSKTAPNLFVAHAICASLNLIAVSRLKRLFLNIDKKSDNIFKKLVNLFDNRSNYSNHDKFCKNSEIPVIPSFAVFKNRLETKADFSIGDSKFEEIDVELDFYKMKYFLSICNPPAPNQSDIAECFRKEAGELSIDWSEKFDEKERALWEKSPIEKKLLDYSIAYKSDWTIPLF